MKKKSFAIVIIAMLFIVLGTSCSKNGMYSGGGSATFSKTESDIFRAKQKNRSTNSNGQLSSNKERNAYKKYE